VTPTVRISTAWWPRRSCTRDFKLAPDFRNAAVSVLMWKAALITILPAVLWPTRDDVLAVALVFCVVSYHVVYRWVAQPRQSRATPNHDLGLAGDADEPVVAGTQ
jgi:hypothetical protein